MKPKATQDYDSSAVAHGEGGIGAGRGNGGDEKFQTCKIWPVRGLV